MAETALQPRTGHLVAVFALLVSSVGGFAPQTHGRLHQHPNNAVAPPGTGPAVPSLFRSRRAPLHCGRCQQRDQWGGIGEQRLPGAWCGQGLEAGDATEQRAAGNSESFFVGGGSGRSSARGWRRNARTSTSVMMALHFPKPPKMQKLPPPLPPPSGDKGPAGGKSAGRHASSTPPAGSTGASSSSSSKGDGDAPSSSKAASKGVAGAVAEGAVGASVLTTKTRDVSARHANAARADLNGGKVSRQEESNRQTKTINMVENA